MSESADGFDYAQDLAEREMGDSVDIDWNDLKNDIKSRWQRWKGKVTKSQFADVVGARLLKKADALEPRTNAPEVVEPAVVSRDNAVDHTMDAPSPDHQDVKDGVSVGNDGCPNLTAFDPSSTATWQYYASNMRECALNTVLTNSGKIVGPIYGMILAAISLMGGYLRSQRANRVQLLASCQGDEESNYYGGVSPFVRSVIDAISENNKELDIETLYEMIQDDASNKILECGLRLNDLDQHPVFHHTRK